MRILGVDYGKKRLGIAVSDETRRIAFPLCVVDGRKSLKAQFAEIFDEKEVDSIVVGYPLDREGEPGRQAKQSETFATRMETWFGIECTLWDERYTSVQSDFTARKSGSKEKKGQRDMTAATIILQSYLDYLLSRE